MAIAADEEEDEDKGKDPNAAACSWWGAPSLFWKAGCVNCPNDELLVGPPLSRRSMWLNMPRNRAMWRGRTSPRMEMVRHGNVPFETLSEAALTPNRWRIS